MGEDAEPTVQVNELENRMAERLSGSSNDAIKGFCRQIPDIPTEQYPEVLIGMGYLYEAFDRMFAPA